jgi:hypothetical protein
MKLYFENFEPLRIWFFGDDGARTLPRKMIYRPYGEPDQPVGGEQPTHCAWHDCINYATAPLTNGWAICTDIPHENTAGYLCPEHTRAFAKMLGAPLVPIKGQYGVMESGGRQRRFKFPTDASGVH